MKIKFMDTYVSTYTFEETLNEMKKIIQTKTVTQHVVLNANKINLMYQDSQLKKIINACPIINADGISIVWANRFLNPNHPVHRVTGIDLFNALIRIAADEGYRVYYLGAEASVLQTLIKVHKENYPTLQIAGYSNGYFDKDNCPELIKEIRLSEADILFVAFPSPAKEFWLDKYKYAINVPLQVGVGGSFDVISGRTKRAPLWMQKAGLEWLFRWLFEPRRLFKRYFIGNFQFLWKVIKNNNGEYNE